MRLLLRRRFGSMNLDEPPAEAFWTHAPGSNIGGVLDACTWIQYRTWNQGWKRHLVDAFESLGKLSIIRPPSHDIMSNLPYFENVLVLKLAPPDWGGIITADLHSLYSAERLLLRIIS
jgi:hypothetical protein